jgi:hypothetical protein
MKSLPARISYVASPDRRDALRWQVELPVSLGTDKGPGNALVRNLSEGGMLIETDAISDVGASILIDLPGIDPIEGMIVWRKESLLGCSFANPIPTAVISAVLLQVPPQRAFDDPGQPEFEEFPIAINPSLDELAHWKESFEKAKGAVGYRIIAYRQTQRGLMIAIAARPDVGSVTPVRS